LELIKQQSNLQKKNNHGSLSAVFYFIQKLIYERRC